MRAIALDLVLYLFPLNYPRSIIFLVILVIKMAFLVYKNFYFYF